MIFSIEKCVHNLQVYGDSMLVVNWANVAQRCVHARDSFHYLKKLWILNQILISSPTYMFTWTIIELHTPFLKRAFS